MKKSFSCYIISETSFGLQCAMEIIKGGHQLLGVISTHYETCRWAKQNNVTVFASLLEFQGLNLYKQFDYLFSIVNTQILPVSMLQLPRLSAINYHNAPLPRYAGVNATSWAILNQEKTHGVTWHEMTQQVDAGDIIRQARFPINEDDTALTLNLRCYEYAIREFKSLLYDIEHNKINKIQQDLSKRTLYVLNKKPFGGGIIDWKQDISYLKRLSRALDFGEYPNLLSKLKILLPNNEVLYPVSLRITQNDENHENQTGEIINLNSSELVISCTNGLIRIKDLYAKDGRKVLLEDLNILYGIKQGDCLPVFDKESLQYFTDYLVLSNGNRRYWQDRLQDVERLELPWKKSADASKIVIKRIEFTKKRKEEELIGYILIYLHKLAQINEVTFKYIDSDTAQQISKTKGLCLGKIINTSISSQDTINDVIANVAKQLVITRNDSRYLSVDIGYEVSYSGNIEIISDIDNAYNEYKYTKLNQRDIRFVLDRKHKYIDVIATTEQDNKILDDITNHIIKLADVYTGKDLLGNITLNTKQELTKLETWNDTKHEYPKDKTIHQLFEESVQANPDRIAITYENQQISYKVLNQRANQLAHYLVKQGASLETPIAIFLPRSPELIIGLLAILKAGGTYVPIDHEYPAERIHYMLEDSKASILLTTQETKDSLDLSATNLHNIICLDEESLNNTLELEKTTNPNIQIPADSLCYIIYTSGSTGRPKGVGVKHSNLAHYLNYSKESYLLYQETIALLHSSIAFDMSITSLYLPLITGNVIYILSLNSQFNVLEAIPKELNKVNFLKFTPTHLKSLNNQDAFKNIINEAKCLIIGGENLLKEDIIPLFNNSSTTAIFNEYGPTETTIGCCTFKIEQLENLAQISIPIGHPIYNTQIHILDTNLNQVPIGVTGEIFIGGVGLARGYIGKPGLTSEKFIANPFATGIKEDVGSRLYRTGDLGRYLPDGNIEFIGRIDHQVKIRGFRIELGEIESVLSQHNQIKQAVVLAREDIPGQKRLVGYVVLKENVAKDQHKESQEFKQELIDNLRELTAKSLPDYMQLSQIVILDELPLTQNGKLDRKALPAPEGREGVGLYQAPEGLLEQKIALIWQELLKIEKVGRNDNFFNLGGHSLIATQLIAKIRKEQKIEIPLKVIFEHPTLQEFARSLTDEYLSQNILPPIERANRDQLIPLSFAQQRLWFIDQLVTGKGLYHIPRAIRLEGELDVLALRQALNYMVKRHETLRTLIVSKEGVGTQVILNEDTSFNLTELTVETKEELDVYLAKESTKPFDLEKTPLCRGSLIKCNESEEYILLIIFHHIISDGWSFGIWNRELSELYLSYKQGIEPNLLPLPIQYADFSIWQRSWLSGDVLEKQLDYWKEQLADISTLELPTDYPRPKEQSYKGSSYNFQLDKETIDSLNAISKDHGTTLFMTILAAFQGTLSKYSNQTDIVVGTPIAGRRMQETENLIGFFVNTLVLRTSTEHNPTFKELLSQVKDTTLGAYSHQDIPFEQLVESLNVPRDLSRHPVFQIMFILQNNKQEELRLGNIKPRMIRNSQTRKSPFDIKLNITETKEGLNLRLEYASDLFKQETIARLCNYYTSFIHEIIQDQDKRLSEICILDEKELTKLQSWNDTAYEYPRDKVIHELFEESVQANPDRIAIIYEGEQISYKVLNQRANQLAHYLIKQGASLETPIAISLPRSPELIIGLLAILKAGGTYVPIDHEYPAERIHYMLEDSKVPIILTHSSIVDQLPNSLVIVIAIDEVEKEFQKEPLINPNIQIPTDSLCYIIYTSGSTGRPKGVGCVISLL